MLGLALTSRAEAADEAFAAHPATGELDRRDRAFARLLILTVLRRLGELDAAISPHLRFQPREPEAMNILRLGAAQLLLLGTPAHAAVNESIRLAGGKLAHLIPMLNAVLRKIAANALPERSAAEKAALNVPAWAMTDWAQALGEPEAVAVAEALLQEAPLDLAVPHDADGWAAKLGGALLPGGTHVRLEGHAVVEELPGYEDGAWWVQDFAAGLPARLLGPVSGQRVLDIGAAPGGKTMQLAAVGAKVTALEASRERCGRLKANLGRTRLDADIVVADVRAWRAPEPYPFILLDAPCSATGTARRHPDVLRAKNETDVERQARLQAEILEAAYPMLAPGGTMVYAVCSLQAAEGERQVEAFLKRHRDLARLPVEPAELPGIEEARTGHGDVRTLPSQWPERRGMDGFFIARLRRNQS